MKYQQPLLKSLKKSEVIQEVVLPGISKLNYSALDKKQGNLTVFSKKRL